jgi:hypothetical protein
LNRQDAKCAKKACFFKLPMCRIRQLKKHVFVFFFATFAPSRFKLFFPDFLFAP